MTQQTGIQAEQSPNGLPEQIPLVSGSFWRRHRDFLIIFLVLILLRIPGLLVWNQYITGSDAAIYMETAMNLAEGKGFVHSVCRYAKSLDQLTAYVQENGFRTQQIKRPPQYIYALSLIYRITGKQGFMTGINLFNLLLFALAILVFYRHLRARYPENRFVQNLSLLWLGTSFTLLEFSFGAWMESLTLLCFMLAFSYHVTILDLGRIKLKQMLLHGLLLSLLALSKHSAVVFVFALLIHLLWRKQYRLLGISGLTVLILAGSWYILRDLLLQGRIIASPTHGFPFTGAMLPSNFFTYFVKLLTERPVNVFRQIVDTMLNLNNLGIIAPFLIGFFALEKTACKQAAVLLLGLPILTYIVYGYVLPRYFYPAFIPLIPAALLYLQKYIQPLGKTAVFYIMAALLATTLIFRISDISGFYSLAYINGKERRALFTEADKMLSEAGVRDSDMLLTNIVGYNVYAKVGYALVPPYIDSQYKYQLLDLYHIDYVLFYVGEPRTLNWADLTDNVDNFSDLQLVARSKRLNYLRLYAVHPGRE